MKYGFREGTRLPKAVDPQKVGPVLANFERKGTLTAENVVESARPEKSPMHAAFTWDDAGAAQERRLDQARYLIGSVRVIIKEGNLSPEKETVKAFHHVPAKNHAGGRAGIYVTPATLTTDVDKFGRALDSARQRLAGARLAVRELETLARSPVLGKIKAVRVHLDKAVEGLDHV